MGSPEIAILPMRVADLDGVMLVERLSFITPWPREAFVSELVQGYATYVVARMLEQIVGYAGMHVFWEDAHITNIAVHPQHRGQHIGERLMRHLIVCAAGEGAHRMTLEVRDSNTAGRRLYEKLGFVTAPGAVRKGYYTDTGEDALIMWLDALVLE